MKPFPPVYFVLPFLTTIISANLDQELKKSIETAMKCNGKTPPTSPVMAVSPSKFIQILVILHERFQTSSCGPNPNVPITVTDQRTWPFCVLGKCEKNECQCASAFTGPKCSIYTKKCWLMYCFLTSCHPIHQSLHCSCDPRLYGTRVSTGIFWYNDGKSSEYKPPPKGWKDQPFQMMNPKDDSSVRIGTSGQNGGSSNQNKFLSSSGGKNELKGSSENQRPRFKNGKVSDTGLGYSGGGLGGKAEAIEKTDVEEALDQLEEVASASRLTPNTFLTILMIFNLCVRFYLLTVTFYAEDPFMV